MESLVKNIATLQLQPDQAQTLETRAQLHRRYSSIEFKILEADDTRIVVRITQDKSFTGNYFDAKRLVEIAHETFDDLAAGRAIHARPVPYNAPPTEVVTPEWIKKKVQESGKKIKDISHELGVDANTLSAYKNGVKPLSGVVKAMFYYYFMPNLGKFYMTLLSYNDDISNPPYWAILELQSTGSIDLEKIKQIFMQKKHVTITST